MFERKPMEEIVQKMITWARGTTSKITDFRVGSKTRTLFEAVAVVIEEFYDRVYRSLRKLIEENIYSVIGFDKIPATYATGIARFSRSTPADANYAIPAGTAIMSSPTDFKAPVKYRTTQEAVLEIGQAYVDVPITAEVNGSRGNMGAGEITTLVTAPSGIEAVVNPSALTNGKDEESKEEQKARFQGFVESNARGVLQAIEYGAKLAKIEDPQTGAVLESVKQARAIEDLATRLGEVDLYIWNGVGDSSISLKAVVDQLQKGFYDSDGNAIYGFKPAGIIVHIYDAEQVKISLEMYLEAEEWSSVEELKPLAEAEIDRYFGTMKMGQTFIQTALEANIKYVEGVKDCKLRISKDSEAFNTDNVGVQPWQICTSVKPITYV